MCLKGLTNAPTVHPRHFLVWVIWRNICQASIPTVRYYHQNLQSVPTMLGWKTWILWPHPTWLSHPPSQSTSRRRWVSSHSTSLTASRPRGSQLPCHQSGCRSGRRGLVTVTARTRGDPSEKEVPAMKLRPRIGSAPRQTFLRSAQPRTPTLMQVNENIGAEWSFCQIYRGVIAKISSFCIILHSHNTKKKQKVTIFAVWHDVYFTYPTKVSLHRTLCPVSYIQVHPRLR